jgi:putative membrane protein
MHYLELRRAYMKRFNFNEFLWFFILGTFTIYMYYLLSTGMIYTFIHPELIRYAAFSFVIFGELAVFQFFKIFTVKTRVTFRNGYMLFFITLIIGIFIAPKGLNPDIWRKKGLTLVSSSRIENIGNHNHDEKTLINGDTIMFNDRNYVHYLEDISSNIEKHVGKKVVIGGFVLRDKSFDKNQFMISRVLMNCCAADSQAVGIKCEYMLAGNLKEGEWVRVEGILGVEKDTPVITVQKLQRTEKPKNFYIYE